MKELYKSPVISVEELEKVDVLCASAEIIDPVAKIDNVESALDDALTYGDLQGLL